MGLAKYANNSITIISGANLSPRQVAEGFFTIG
jgi:hypothetical protein